MQKKKQCTGYTMQSLCCGCLQGSPCKRPGRWLVLVHMVEMVTQVVMQTRASRHGSRQMQANKAWQGKAWQMRTSSCSTTQVGTRSWPASGLVGEVLWRKCGGAGRSGSGLGPTLLSPPNLSPLPVFVHTHSLSLQQQNDKI